MIPTIQEFHERSIAFLKTVKSEAVREYGVGTDVPTTLSVLGADGTVMMIQMNDDKFESVVVTKAIAHLLKPELMCYMVETFAVHLPPDVPVPPEFDVAGSLAKAFAAGDTRVAEALTVFTFNAEGVILDKLAYRYGAERDLTWYDCGPEGIFDTYDKWSDSGAMQLVEGVAASYALPSLPELFAPDITDALRFDIVSRQLSAAYPGVRIYLASERAAEEVAEELAKLLLQEEAERN